MNTYAQAATSIRKPIFSKEMTWIHELLMWFMESWNTLFLEKMKTGSMIGSKTLNNLGGQLRYESWAAALHENPYEE